MSWMIEGLIQDLHPFPSQVEKINLKTLVKLGVRRSSPSIWEEG